MTRDNRRSIHSAHLFVPAVRGDLAIKALRSPASAIIVDLEDSVPATRKEEARGYLAEIVASGTTAGKSVYVRVNNEEWLLRDDVHSALTAGATGLVVPKAESVDQLVEIDAWVSRWEQQAGLLAGTIELELQVETAAGLLRAPELASAASRTSSMMLGVEDFSTELGTDPNDKESDLRWAHSHVLLAAVAAGIAPYGLIGAFSNYKDTEAYAAAARRSRAFGYVGAYCIHPAQVPLAVQAFSPSPEQLVQAQQVVAAYEAAEAGGLSATSLDGRMIDRPVAERARRLLDRAGAPAGSTHEGPIHD